MVIRQQRYIQRQHSQCLSPKVQSVVLRSDAQRNAAHERNDHFGNILENMLRNVR